MTPEQAIAQLVDHGVCPECGAQGLPGIRTPAPGLQVVVPTYQCDTEGCHYNREGYGAWTLVLNG